MTAECTCAGCCHHVQPERDTACGRRVPLLAGLLHHLPTQKLRQLHLLMRPDTILRQHRELLNQRHAATSAPEPAGERLCRKVRVTARTEATDRMLIFGERHLRLVLAEYEAHYNGRRPHRSRQLCPPRPDHPVADLSRKRIQRPPVLGGLINEYERAA